MSTLTAVKTLSIEQYLAQEGREDIRHEYLDGLVYAMVGGTAAHNLLAGRLYAAVLPCVGAKHCNAYISDMKVRVADAFYYPDVVVSCEPYDPRALFLTAPTLIVEVLSEPTEARDRFEKQRAYRGLISLEEYVLVAQDRMEVDIYRRRDDAWLLEECRTGDEIVLDSLSLRVTMARLYEGLIKS